MPSAADEISAAIAADGGAIPISEYMQLALHGQGGFYTTGGRAGRRGGDSTLMSKGNALCPS